MYFQSFDQAWSQLLSAKTGGPCQVDALQTAEKEQREQKEQNRNDYIRSFIAGRILAL